MSNEEKALAIVKATDGFHNECLDWLNEGDIEDMTIEELIKEWSEIGATFSA